MHVQLLLNISYAFCTLVLISVLVAVDVVVVGGDVPVLFVSVFACVDGQISQ